MTNTKDLQIVVKAKDEASSTLKKLSGEASSMAQSFGLGSISILGIAASAGYLGKKMIEAAAGFEQTKVAFKNMMGSAEQANTLLKQLADLAVKTPFELKDLEEGAKRLMAYGTASANIVPQLTMIGTAASLTGVPVNQLANAFGQVQVKGKLMGGEVLQFFNAGIPITRLLAESMGKTTGEISKLIETGKIGFNDLNKVMMENYGVASKNGKLMEEQSQTFLGRVSNLKDSWDQFLRTQGNQLLVWGKLFVDKAVEIVNWLRADAEGLNYVGKMIYGLSQLLNALGQTVWAVANVFGGLIIMLGQVGQTGYALVQDMIANFGSLGTRLKQIFGAVGQAMRGDFQGATDSIKSSYSGLFQNTVSQFGKMKEVGKDVSFGVGEAFKSAGTAWGNFSSLKGFDSMKVKLGELPAAIDGSGGAGGSGGGEKNADKLKKQQEAFAKLGKEISDYATKANDDLKEVTKSIDETVKKMEELTSQNTQDNRGINNDMVSAYVAQEQKVTDLKKEVEQKKADITLKLNDQVDGDNIKSHNEELARMQSELSAKETLYNKEKSAFEQRRQIEVAFQQQVDEARKRASMTEFERTMNDLATKQLALNIEFDKKKTALESELKMNLDKAAVMKQIQDKAALEYKKSLALNEKSTVDSINNEIAHWNTLAEAMTRAKQGKTSNTISAASINQRLEQIGSQQKMQAPINITITGNTLLDKQAGEKIGNQLLGALSFNTQLA